MGALAAAHLSSGSRRVDRDRRSAPLVLALLVAALPVQGLMGYYDYGRSGQRRRVDRSAAREVARVDPGTKLFIVYSDAMLAASACRPIWESYATMQGRAFEFVPLDQVLGRLYVERIDMILCTR